MSKLALKKELQRLTKEQLVEQILDLYDKNKAVKEFSNFIWIRITKKNWLKSTKKLSKKNLDG